MNISFCLPGIPLYPVGGVKIVFEYSNRLVKKGHNIDIYFNCENAYKKYKVPNFFRKIVSNFMVNQTPRWFDLNRKINKKCIFGINDSNIKKSDFIIATAVNTAEDVYNLDKNKGKKAYLIQDFENWNHENEYVYQTYNYNMKNIVISKWLKKIVDSKSNYSSIYIPNGIDFDVFGIDIPIKKRKKHSIAMLYHEKKHKGSKYGIETIKSLKEQFQDLEVKMFGVPKRPENLPNWIEYTRNANEQQLRKIYNNSSIFLSTSIKEGFGLTGAESMACGCALVSTNYKGVKEYAVHDKNSLISPIKDIDSLIKNIKKLFQNDSLRIKIAREGSKNIKSLSWENAIDKFEKKVLEINE